MTVKITFACDHEMLFAVYCVSLSGLACFDTDYLKLRGAVLGMVFRMMIGVIK